MKKLRLAITALILCTLCLSACGEKGNEYVKAVEKDPSPENVYNLVSSSAENFKNSGAYSADLNADISFTVKGIKTSLTPQTSVIRSGDNYRISADLGGFGGKTELTFIDEVTYCLKENGDETTKYKANMAKEDFLEECPGIILSDCPFAIPSYADFGTTFTKKDFEKADVKISDSDITVTIGIADTEALQKMLGDMAKDVTGTEAGSFDGEAVIVIDKEGNITAISLTASAGEDTAAFSISAGVVFETSKVPEIKLPEGADEYKNKPLDQDDLDAYAIYKKAIEALTGDSAYSVNITRTTTIDGEGATISVYSRANGEKMYAELDSSATGKVCITYIGGVVYINNPSTESKVKYLQDLDTFKSQNGLENNGMHHFRRTDFLSSYKKYDEENGQTLIRLASAGIKELARNYFEKISGGYEFDISKANLTIIIDSEGNIVSEEYNFGARFHVGTDIIGASIVITEEIDGTDPEITVPSDESEYKYVDSNG